MQFATRAACFQLSLRELFGLMTYAACTAAITNAWGMGTFITAAGGLVAWMNYLGHFAIIQAGHGRWIAIGIGWSLFLGSMFLPACRGLWGETLIGWAAAWGMIPAPFEFLLTLSNALTTEEVVRTLSRVHCCLLIDFANFCGTIAPATLRWTKCWQQRYLGMILNTSMPIVWLLPIHVPFFFGYYAWVLGLTILASTHPIDRRTAQWMLVTTSIYWGLTRYLVYLTQTTS